MATAKRAITWTIRPHHEPVPPAALDEEEQEIRRTVETGEWDEVHHMEEEKRRIQTFFGKSHRPRE